MSEIEVDTDDLRAFTEKLSALVGYTTALKSGAAAVAYMLPNEWQGPAMQQFIATFQAWETTGAALEQNATAIRDLASAVLQAYDSAISGSDQIWTDVSTQFDTAGV